MKLKAKMFTMILIWYNNCLILAIIQIIQNDDSNKLVFGKMKGETAAIAVKDILPLKPKTYSFSVDDSREDKKQRMWIKVLLQQ